MKHVTPEVPAAVITFQKEHLEGLRDGHLPTIFDLFSILQVSGPSLTEHPRRKAKFEFSSLDVLLALKT